MDSIKDSLKRELQTISFTEQRKQEMVQHVEKSWKSKFNTPVWKYRAVLTTVILFAISLVFFNSNTESTPVATQAAGGGKISFPDLLTSDSVKTILLAMLFFVVYLLLKKNLKKKGKGLPKCAQCKDTWSRQTALRKILKNEKIACPNCGAENHQTRKSSKKTSAFQILLPIMIICANIFDNGTYGMIVYLFYVILFGVALMPYYLELQLEDPKNEPLW
ncbi:hypothetical protein M3197_13980 [Sporosarcina aquimarina]|uniref:TIGR04104 family putative zinc finger protein n=1 Tax=Sporosarcina aquimarina TaxID=114975 RepID=UPI0020409CBC|nr:TIGR04104 family putative zinc finger protein [Sporosarcina aquimarina]MCM3758570.1 hypothetical protein [Sporosarcina aquimarina]